MASDRYVYLVQCLHAEVLRKCPTFSWRAVAINAIINKEKRFYALWRFAEYLNKSSSLLLSRFAQRIVHQLYFSYGCDIELGTQIGPGLRIRHFNGIVINRNTRIGRQCTLRQNTTIGAATPHVRAITLGDNVSIGANACIIGDDLHIGNNVTIGAAAFINKNIPDNSICYSQHILLIRPKIPKEKTL